jgi:hypothetical protein
VPDLEQFKKVSGEPMRSLPVAAVFVALATAHSGLGAPPAAAPPENSTAAAKPDKDPADAADDELDELDARLSFAPMWGPIPRFTEPGGPVPSHFHAIVWEPAWQRELGISAEQKNALEAIRDKAVTEARQHSEQFQKLSPEEKQAEVKSWGGKSAPWRQQLDEDVRKQIEAVLTPEQLTTILDYSFPHYVLAVLYDAKKPQEIGFGPEQQEAFRQLAREHQAAIQEELLKQAEEIWGLMSPQQQAQLADVVKRQGPTSAILSLAFEVGFDPNAMALHYPMLSELPVRKRLKLSDEQERQLQAVMAGAGARSEKARKEGTESESSDENKKQLEAILTSAQLAMLKQIDLRRAVVLAMGYPDKQKSIGITDQQSAGIQRIQKETHQRQYRVDRELLAKAVQILTPAQREQLRTQQAQGDEP